MLQSADKVVKKRVSQVGTITYVKVGDNDVVVNPKFKMYFTTKLTNPHYPPEISARTTITNFAIKVTNKTGKTWRLKSCK